MADLEVVVTEGSSLTIQVEEDPDVFVNVAIPPPVEVVEVRVPGPAGPPGEDGTGGAHEHDHIANLEADSRDNNSVPSDYPYGLSQMYAEDDVTEDTIAYWLAKGIVTTQRVHDEAASADRVVQAWRSGNSANSVTLYRLWEIATSTWTEWDGDVKWAKIPDKPFEFPPEVHEHDTDYVNEEDFTWENLIGKPSTFTPTTFTHTQIPASDTWTVNHMLGRRPTAISIIDTGGNQVEGEIQHTSINQFLALFGSAFSGEVLYI